MSKTRPTNLSSKPGPDAAPATGGLFSGWQRFWFTPADPIGFHAIRLLTGLLLLSWLLPFAGHQDALFGLDGWFDKQAYAEAAKLPEGPPAPLGWSVLFLCGTNPTALTAAYWTAIAVLALFTLGVATRITSLLTWVFVVSFTANPALEFDADSLLGILSFYLMIGYVLTGQRGSQALLGRILGSRNTWLLGGPGESATGERRPSIGANLAVRLLQVHFALVVVTTGLHKLQFGDWWAGVALWYPLHPPFETTVDRVRSLASGATTYMTWLSASAYAVLAWQIGFPLFAWRTGWWRLLLLGGGVVSWCGMVWCYDLPLFGPIFMIGCLSYLTGNEWRTLFSRFPARSGQGGVGVERSARAESGANLVTVEHH